MRAPGRVLCLTLALLAYACSSSEEGPSNPSAAACSNGQCGSCDGCFAACICETGSNNNESCLQVCGGVGGSAGSGAGTGGSGAFGTGGSGVAGTGGTGVAGSSSGGVGGSGGSGVVDPNAVDIPGLACGGVLDANVMTPFVEIGGRQVFVDYACGKPSGTPVTFILNLHGTMAQEGGKHYIRGYFPTHEYTGSHNFIVATPKSVVSQWANGDGGRDEPHLMAVIDYMYQTFTGFDIRQMWIVGHSWGAMYTRTFGCKAELADKVHGVVLMSGGSGMPACADRLAALGTVGETDIVAGQLTQAAAASAHGCAAQATLNIGNNVVTHWPSCQPGWVHKNYFMLGKGHGFSPADWPERVMIDDMVEAIVSTR